MPLLQPITKAAYVVRCNGFRFEFTQFSGINDTASSSEYASGTGNRIRKVVGPRTIDDVTLTAPYDPEFATEAEIFWLEYECEPLTITIQPTTCGNNPVDLGDPYVLYGCRLQSLKTGEVDRESSDVQKIELTFTVDYWTR
jgi:hypothetical protein